MRLQHRSGAVRAVFDDPNLLSCAGLEPVMRLAEQAGLHNLVDQVLHLPGSTGSNPSGKVAAIIAGMLAGADSIDDLNLIRHGGMRSLFTGVYAPSTLGSFLRTFTHGHALQLHAAARNLLVALADRVDLLPGIGQLCFIDIDSMLRRVYGKQKQGARFGHAKVGGYDVRLRGLSPLLVTLTTPKAAPVIATARLRAGNAASVRGAASMVAQVIGTAAPSAPPARSSSAATPPSTPRRSSPPVGATAYGSRSPPASTPRSARRSPPSARPPGSGSNTPTPGTPHDTTTPPDTEQAGIRNRQTPHARSTEYPPPSLSTKDETVTEFGRWIEAETDVLEGAPALGE